MKTFVFDVEHWPDESTVILKVADDDGSERYSGELLFKKEDWRLLAGFLTGTVYQDQEAVVEIIEEEICCEEMER